MPLLVAHTVRRSGNVGQSVGTLYFVNTLGSAIASILAVMRIMGPFGQQGTVRLAACINIAVGITVLVMHLRTKMPVPSPSAAE